MTVSGTTGGRAPYADINTKEAIDSGRTPGPRVHLTAPYLTGGFSPGAMASVNTPDEARRFVAYWGSEGATWIKAYADIRRAELQAMGLSAVLYANAALQGALLAVIEVLGSLRDHGSLQLVSDRLVSFDRRQEAVAKDKFDMLEKRYR